MNHGRWPDYLHLPGLANKRHWKRQFPPTRRDNDRTACGKQRRRRSRVPTLSGGPTLTNTGGQSRRHVCTAIEADATANDPEAKRLQARGT
jgi:hypothetical protein